METKIEGGFLVVRVPLIDPRPSTSGKTLVVATTGGNVPVAGGTIGGKTVKVGLTAFIPA